jgi:xanthine dehydrogenase accessory factor
MLFADHLILMRGGGDLATGVAYRLHKAGFPLIILELPRPLVVRRRVALATAVLEGSIDVETLHAQRVGAWSEATTVAATGNIPVLVRPELPFALTRDDRRADRPRIIVDARMAKRNIDTRLDQADLVVALGPGFIAGVDCHAVIETHRGHRLGRVIWSGRPLPNTGRPGRVGGKSSERVLRAPVAGAVTWQVSIGDLVHKGQPLGRVADVPVSAPFDGVVRGLIAPGIEVGQGVKIGDVDPRADVESCLSISDKALAVGGGVLEAVLVWMNDPKSGYNHEP